MIKNNIDINEILYEDIELPKSSLGLSKYNNTYFFLLPIFQIHGLSDYSSFKGVYYKDKERDSTLENCIYIISSVNDLSLESNNNLHNALLKKPEYKYNYYAGNNNNKDMIAYVLQCDKDYIEDYNHIVNGDYSKVSDKYLIRLTNYTNNKENCKKLLNICRKNKEFKQSMENFLDVNLDNQELWCKFEPEREIYRYGYIKTNNQNN